MAFTNMFNWFAQEHEPKTATEILNEEQRRRLVNEAYMSIDPSLYFGSTGPAFDTVGTNATTNDISIDPDGYYPGTIWKDQYDLEEPKLIHPTIRNCLKK